MRDTRVAVRYAKALFDLSIEQNLLEPINLDMKFVSEVCSESKDFKAVLSSPVIRPDKKISIFNQIFADKINKMSLNFLNIIINKRRDNNIIAIAKQFNVIYNDYKGIELASVTSAFPLDETQKANLILTLKKKTNKQVILTEYIDPSIIGGFILNFGGNIYDASVIDKTKTLEREFKPKH